MLTYLTNIQFEASVSLFWVSLFVAYFKNTLQMGSELNFPDGEHVSLNIVAMGEESQCATVGLEVVSSD